MLSCRREPGWSRLLARRAAAGAIKYFKFDGMINIIGRYAFLFSRRSALASKKRGEYSMQLMDGVRRWSCLLSLLFIFSLVTDGSAGDETGRGRLLAQDAARAPTAGQKATVTTV